MAETSNPAATPGLPAGEEPGTPQEVSAPTPDEAPKENKLRSFIAQLLTSTFWITLGGAFLLLSILLRYKFHQMVPAILQPLILVIFPDPPFFSAGLGLICAAIARNYVRKEYEAETEKNRLFLHAWKIPLILTQVIIFWVSAIYAILVGLGWIPKLSDAMGLTCFFLLFFGYLLWYMTAHFMNRFPSFAGIRIALLSIILAIGAYGAWAAQRPFFSLICALFAVLSGMVSVMVAPFHREEHRAPWVRILSLGGTLILLLLVGVNALPMGKPRLQLLSLGLITQNIFGSVEDIAYSPDGRRLAVVQDYKGGRFLQVVVPDSGQLPVFKVHAGESSFHPVFVENGHFILVDGVRNGVRNLWQVNASDGSIFILSHESIEPFGDGRPWNEATRQFLYVSKQKDKYLLRVRSMDTQKTATLLTASAPFGTPSWTASGEEISYVDGSTHEPYVLDVESGESTLLTPTIETLDEAPGDLKPRKFQVQEVFSAPDDFRYLFLAKTGKETSIWSVMPDGSKRYKLFETKNSIRHVSWTPDAQEIVFEESGRDFGYLGEVRGIKVLKANTGAVNNLIAPQLSHKSPAISPDGAKIAFAAHQGLWVSIPFFTGDRTGVWVAVLR